MVDAHWRWVLPCDLGGVVPRLCGTRLAVPLVGPLFQGAPDRCRILKSLAWRCCSNMLQFVLQLDQLSLQVTLPSVDTCAQLL